MNPSMQSPPVGGGRDKQGSENTETPKKIGELPGYFFGMAKGFFKRLFYIYGLVWATKPWILFAMLFTAVAKGVLPVISALVGRELLNLLVEAVRGEVLDFSKIFSVLAVQFLLMLSSRIVNQVDTTVSMLAGELVSNHIKMMIITKAKSVDTASFDMPEFYQKMENANREAGSRPVQILSATFNAMSVIISVVSFIAVLATISVFAPLVIIAMSVPSAVINFIYRRKTFEYYFKRSKERRRLNYYTNVMCGKDYVKEVKILGMSDMLIGKYKNVFKSYFSGLRKLIVGEGAWHIVIAVLTTAVNMLLCVYVAKMIFDGRLQVGDYSLYSGALNSILSGVSTLVASTAKIYEGTLFIDNLISFMNEKQTVVPRLSKPEKIKRHTAHTVEFSHVSFRYPGTSHDVIKDVSFKLAPCESVVLVGLNGAGKTTLLKLLTRLYDPTEGEILLDGKDLRDYDTEELYSVFGTVFQDFGKYAFSVKENIALGNLSVAMNDEKIRYAAAESSADEFINRMDMGYETPLMRIFEEGGIELSGGQWQKLAIARAFYSDSDIMILDEPTASLDAMAEQDIFDRFDALSANKTTIFVSHRLSSATKASKILVLDNGSLVEEGTHEELMKLGGIYCRLFTTQAKRYIEHGKELGNTED